MIKLTLPFSMGRMISIDPVTLYQHIDHPVLDIGSGYATIKEDIKLWLYDTFGYRFNTGFDGTDYFLQFATEDDLTLFRLRWL